MTSAYVVTDSDSWHAADASHLRSIGTIIVAVFVAIHFLSFIIEINDEKELSAYINSLLCTGETCIPKQRKLNYT